MNLNQSIPITPVIHHPTKDTMENSIFKESYIFINILDQKIEVFQSIQIFIIYRKTIK